MNIIGFVEDYFKSLQISATKIYLIAANIILVIFAIWFSNVGLLPFKNVGDFAFFALLALILALYRPGWTFAFFIGTLALENINLIPDSFGISLRPYQFFGFITILSLLIRFFSRRLNFSFPKFGWQDILVLLFALGGFLSAIGALDKGMSFKQSIVALSFVALYFLARIYIQSFGDLKRVAPFFLSSGIIVLIYGIWQNIRFLDGNNPFEVMPGRPNATFTEPDWFGIYLVFVLSVLYAILYFFNKEKSKVVLSIHNSQFTIFNQFFNFQILKKIIAYVLILVVYVALIITVSRSAWIGAIFVTLVYLKFVLLEGYGEFNGKSESKWQRYISTLKVNRWQWKKAGIQLFFLAVVLGASLLISAPLTRFEIADRAVSTGGLQKITIACPKEDMSKVPVRIQNLSDVREYGCWQINLEEIDKYRNSGISVGEVYRPDPNVNIRAEIYKKSWEQIKSNPVFGLGWGGISSILGNDERGAGLNASNIFLEIWLGSGLLGFLSLVMLLVYIMLSVILAFLKNSFAGEKGITLVFLALAWIAIVIPNLFNSGIFLGFVWAYLGVSVSLLAKKQE
ncbi:MAG: hypothetical protein ACD_9C00020G0004 [uncultured bacterium]|nr:MAG: hypothetical protein ACD_9C00020G0004 [uncultured bacterium]